MLIRYKISVSLATLAVIFIVGSTLPNNLSQCSYKKKRNWIEIACKKMLKYKREIGIIGYVFATAHLLMVIPFSVPVMSISEIIHQYKTGLISWFFFTLVFLLSFPKKILTNLPPKKRISWSRCFMYPGLVTSVWHCLHIGQKSGRYSPILSLLTIALTAIIFRWWNKKKRWRREMLTQIKRGTGS